MRLGHLIGLVLGGATAAGCSGPVPADRPAPPVLPETWRASPAVPVDAADRARVPVRWWEGFDDPLLSDLVSDALAANPGVAAAGARLAAARALQRPADVAGRPRIDATASVRGERRLAGQDGSAALGSRGSVPTALEAASGTGGTDRNTIVRQAGFDATWEIDLFGRLAAERTAAEAETEAAAADLLAARATLAAEVVSAFADLRTAVRQRRLRAEEAALRGRAVALASRRRDAGLATDAEVARAEGAHAEALARLSDREAAAGTASLRLAVLSGRTVPDPHWSQPAGPLRPPRTPTASLPADLLRDRPDIRRAEARVVAAAAHVGIARADLLPRLTLTGSLTTAANLVGDALSGPLTVLGGGPALTIPLFDREGRRAVRDARVAAWHAAVEDHRLLVLDGYADAEAAIARLVPARIGRDTALLAVERAERAAEHAKRRRDAGLSADDEELEAMVAVLEARMAEAEASRAEAVAVVALFKALGTGAAPP